MATVQSMNLDRLLTLEADTVIGGHIDGAGDLILEQHDSSTINAGSIIATVPDASETVKGKVELATNAETATGTDSTRAVTPAGLASLGIGASLASLDGRLDSVEATLAGIINLIYPVGSVYISVVSTNPNTLFGVGTWSAWGAGRVPVGIDAGQAEFDTVEETGGAKTHTLSLGEMPTHSHAGTTDGETTQASFPLAFNGGAGTNASGTGSNLKYSSGNYHQHNFTTNNAGSGSAHNNLQPYVVCYMWKRTA